jgi:hypothetical protein
MPQIPLANPQAQLSPPPNPYPPQTAVGAGEVDLGQTLTTLGQRLAVKGAQEMDQLADGVSRARAHELATMMTMELQDLESQQREALRNPPVGIKSPLLEAQKIWPQSQMKIIQTYRAQAAADGGMVSAYFTQYGDPLFLNARDSMRGFLDKSALNYAQNDIYTQLSREEGELSRRISSISQGEFSPGWNAHDELQQSIARTKKIIDGAVQSGLFSAENAEARRTGQIKSLSETWWRNVMDVYRDRDDEHGTGSWLAARLREARDQPTSSWWQVREFLSKEGVMVDVAKLADQADAAWTAAKKLKADAAADNLAEYKRMMDTRRNQAEGRFFAISQMPAGPKRDQLVRQEYEALIPRNGEVHYGDHQSSVAKLFQDTENYLRDPVTKSAAGAYLSTLIAIDKNPTRNWESVLLQKTIGTRELSQADAVALQNHLRVVREQGGGGHERRNKALEDNDRLIRVMGKSSNYLGGSDEAVRAFHEVMATTPVPEGKTIEEVAATMALPFIAAPRRNLAQQAYSIMSDFGIKDLFDAKFETKIGTLPSAYRDIIEALFSDASVQKEFMALHPEIPLRPNPQQPAAPTAAVPATPSRGPKF